MENYEFKFYLEKGKNKLKIRFIPYNQVRETANPKTEARFQCLLELSIFFLPNNLRTLWENSFESYQATYPPV